MEMKSTGPRTTTQCGGHKRNNLNNHMEEKWRRKERESKPEEGERISWTHRR
jgi:hypothetical protein